MQDFSYGKTSGLQGFLDKYAYEKNLKEFSAPSDRITNYFTVARNWPSKSNSNPKEMIDVAETKLIPILNAFDRPIQGSVPRQFKRGSGIAKSLCLWLGC